VPRTRAAVTPVPWAAIAAAVLALPTAFVLVVVGWGALLFANQRADGAVWVVLLISVAWLAGLLVAAIRLLLGRSWAALALTAGAVAVLMTSGLLHGGLGGGPFGFGALAALVSLATTVLAALPGVRRWVAERRRERLYPGSTQPAAGGAPGDAARGGRAS
jgi:hypothetical protein